MIASYVQEYNEAKEQKSRLMLELEQEKMKLEGDILKLNRNKVRPDGCRVTINHSLPQLRIQAPTSVTHFSSLHEPLHHLIALSLYSLLQNIRDKTSQRESVSLVSGDSSACYYVIAITSS